MNIINNNINIQELIQFKIYILLFFIIIFNFLKEKCNSYFLDKIIINNVKINNFDLKTLLNFFIMCILLFSSYIFNKII